MGSLTICLYIKFFFTHLRSAFIVRDDLGAVRFVNTETAFNLRNVDSGPTFLATLRRILRRVDGFMVVLYPISVPFFSGPMTLRIYNTPRKLTRLDQAEEPQVLQEGSLVQV